jgi:hypothetical protein
VTLAVRTHAKSDSNKTVGGGVRSFRLRRLFARVRSSFVYKVISLYVLLFSVFYWFVV